MHISTGKPTAKLEDGRITLSFPSGTDTVHAAINPNDHAQLLARSFSEACKEVFALRSTPLPPAEIIGLMQARHSCTREAA